MTRVPPALLLQAVARNAARCPILPHHVQAIRVRSRGAPLTAGQSWWLDQILRLPALSARQQERLNDLAAEVERGRA